MYRVLLVDDEINIVDALQDALQQMDDDRIEYVKAYSGQKALQCLNRMQIDVVVTDISMPRIDGIELLRKIEELWPRCKVIFLTCHDDFEYAQKAANLNCFRYLMKYDGYQIVHQTIQEAIQAIENEAGMLWISDDVQGACQVCRKRNDFLKGIFSGDQYETDERKRKLNEVALSFSGEKPVRMFSLYMNKNHFERMLDLENLLLRCEQRISRLAEGFMAMVPLVSGTELICLLQEKGGEDSNYVGGRISGMLEMLLTAEKENESLEIAQLRDPLEWNDIGYAYKTMQWARNHNSYENKIIIIPSPFLEITKWREKTIQCIYKNVLLPGISDEYDRFLSGTDKNPYARQGIREGLLIVLADKLCENGFSFQVSNLMIRMNGEDDIWESSETIRSFLLQVVSTVKGSQKEEERSMKQKTIEKARWFIENNLRNNISLTDVAESVYLNPSYLSRLFKQELGENVINYINRIRVEKAQKLLVSTNMKIIDIAKETGFSSSGYFSAVFRRYTGMNPMDYKVKY